MSHHESNPDDASMRRIAEAFNLGATGKFPEGKITPRDEGEITMGVAAAPGTVLLNFGKPVSWIGFTPEQATAIANSLLENAKKATELAK
jgi:hypothetical protein